ncbi:MAG: hypothetical protein M9939_01425 [Mesorhizobium sp.]|jgi:hypothetical protein|nr:hypothetical protein [Mesorhizobium sp.]MCO5159769.1 hypothetical protein [Mesorhizobium sp.]
MGQGLGELDALMREEKRLTALESQTEAWADGLSAGIEPELIAEVALTTALTELLRSCGEDAAVALVDRMRERIISGEFTPEIRRH